MGKIRVGLNERGALDAVAVYSTADVLALLHACIKASGSLRKYAKQTGLSAAYLSDVLNDNREPGAKLCKALGFTKHTVRKVSYTRSTPTEHPNG